MTNQLKLGNKRFWLTVHKHYLCLLISHLCPLKRRQIRYTNALKTIRLNFSHTYFQNKARNKINKLKLQTRNKILK